MHPNPLARLDPRVKLIAFLTVQAWLFVSAAQPAWTRLLGIAVALLALLPFAGRSWRLWLRTLALCAPMLAILAGAVFFQSGFSGPALHRVLLLLARFALAFLSLALFVQSVEPGRMLQALRQAGLPQSAAVVLSLGYRFSGQLRLELVGMQRAWVGRNIGNLPKWRQARRLGSAFPLFFERLLESSLHVHDAMLARGFQGRLPAGQQPSFSRGDALFVLSLALGSAAIAVL